MDEGVQKYLEQPQVGTLKLSEAIRIGAMMTRPMIGDYFGGGNRACAMGAALIAVGADRSKPTDEIQRLWPNVPFGTLCDVAHKNNSGTHTREQTADWLESIGY